LVGPHFTLGRNRARGEGCVPVVMKIGQVTVALAGSIIAGPAIGSTPSPCAGKPRLFGCDREDGSHACRFLHGALNARKVDSSFNVVRHYGLART